MEYDQGFGMRDLTPKGPHFDLSILNYNHLIVFGYPIWTYIHVILESRMEHMVCLFSLHAWSRHKAP